MLKTPTANCTTGVKESVIRLHLKEKPQLELK